MSTNIISIFTPTHNSSFLPEIYKSLQTQTDQNWEWVIIYNHDAKVINFNDERVKGYFANDLPEWVGPLKARACEKATGDIFIELDHDDLLMPSAVEEVRKAFEDQEIGFVYSNTIHATGDYAKIQRFDEIYGWKYREVVFQDHILDEHISFKPTPEAISRIWFAPNHLRAFRRSVYEEVGGYNVNMRILDDLDLMCRLYKITKFKHIDKGLYVYRVHGENTWLRFNSEIQDNVYRIYDKYIESLVETWADASNLKKVELGGRMASKNGYETVDLKDADIICDLNGRWPYADSSVGVIRAFDVFEHLVDPIHSMKELQRVLAPGGFAFIQVPSTDGRGAWQDPTHCSFWNENSFLYYTNNNWARYIDNPVRFQAPRLYTTEFNENKVCWVVAHLINLKDNYRPCGEVLI
jgi:glycosyltransferase involved in cell wall biosynthesis